MKFGLYNASGLVDTCRAATEKEARATFRKWYGLSSLRGWSVWEMNDGDGWYSDNIDSITSAAQYKQTVTK